MLEMEKTIKLQGRPYGRKRCRQHPESAGQNAGDKTCGSIHAGTPRRAIWISTPHTFQSQTHTGESTIYVNILYVSTLNLLMRQVLDGKNAGDAAAEMQDVLVAGEA